MGHILNIDPRRHGSAARVESHDMTTIAPMSFLTRRRSQSQDPPA
jgi:hypothetical protein